MNGCSKLSRVPLYQGLDLISYCIHLFTVSFLEWDTYSHIFMNWCFCFQFEVGCCIMYNLSWVCWGYILLKTAEIPLSDDDCCAWPYANMRFENRVLYQFYDFYNLEILSEPKFYFEMNFILRTNLSVNLRLWIQHTCTRTVENKEFSCKIPCFLFQWPISQFLLTFILT